MQSARLSLALATGAAGRTSGDGQYGRYDDAVCPFNITATIGMHLYTEQGSKQLITFVLIQLEECVIRVLLSDTQLSACVKGALCYFLQAYKHTDRALDTRKSSLQELIWLLDVL